MEHVDNDMDDLFRKAGELYPLKTSESDWDGVLGKFREEISGDASNLSGLNAQAGRKSRRWLFLLLLLPLSFISLIYFSGSGKKQKPGPTNSLAKTHLTPSNIPSTNHSSLSEEQARSSAEKKQSAQPLTATGIPSKIPVASVKNRSPGVYDSEQQHQQSAGKPGKNEKAISDAISAQDASERTATNHSLNPNDRELFHEPVEKTVSLSVYGPSENPTVYGMLLPIPVETRFTLNNATTGSGATPKSDKKVSSKGLYAVLLAGPDLSTVAFQSTSQAGYSLGVLLGYRFNKHLAVETGLLWDKKYYYSNGEYFDKSKTSIPSSVTILNLDGNCNMYEIPLSFRYDFAIRGKHGFFATAGLSSYLMKKEYYSYYAEIDSPPNPIYYKTYAKNYNKSFNYFLSVVQLSAGYVFAIGEKSHIRIEPYFKIPLQGIGTGSMTISSTGLYFGISHSFR